MDERKKKIQDLARKIDYTVGELWKEVYRIVSQAEVEGTKDADIITLSHINRLLSAIQLMCWEIKG